MAASWQAPGWPDARRLPHPHDNVMIADGATRRRLAYYSCDRDAKASRARANCASDSACAPAGAVATATPSIIAA
ncbi:hypothetical protein G6F62_015584 [Rhizopus arrhizus]|nr:hypothetical protein G6F62_015584 [Rhizopus arrhizus]